MSRTLHIPDIDMTTSTATTPTELMGVKTESSTIAALTGEATSAKTTASDIEAHLDKGREQWQWYAKTQPGQPPTEVWSWKIPKLKDENKNPATKATKMKMNVTAKCRGGRPPKGNSTKLTKHCVLPTGSIKHERGLSEIRGTHGSMIEDTFIHPIPSTVTNTNDEILTSSSPFSTQSKSSSPHIIILLDHS
ncbi:hypothetical protein BDA99DRAFT_563258 [Phascolomyces articulosus]|uniref:Uncharacterized protein n=1 Tax=Phascolomyces articulosus TaxID=60185 RepID=A0AAD5K2M6_9FUNG|nr:hypothetical protein BDA99DRAFT_563258 [Phascolomyces articulosus]